MNSYKITRIEITENNGAFQEWAEAGGDTFPESDIERWQQDYYGQIVKQMGEIFPDAKIEMSEGYDQHISHPLDVTIKRTDTATDDTIEADDKWAAQSEADELVRQYYDDVCDRVSNNGTFWGA